MPQHIKVLIADDNPLDSELLLRQLRRADFDVESTRVDNEVDFTAALTTPYDLILSDYAMGQFNGMRALEIVKQHGLDTPFILISGTIGEDLAVEAIKRGAADYLLKDRLTRLGSAITHALTEGALRRERKKSETALWASESRYRVLVEQASDGIFTVGTDGRYIDVNASGLEMLGYTREEFLTRSLGEMIAPEQLSRLGEEVGRLRRGERRVSEWMIRKRDGTWIEVEISARSLPDGKLLGMVRDLTERRRSESELRESNERLQQIADNIDEVFWITDVTKRVVIFVSKAYEKIWGRSRESLYAAPVHWIETIHPDDRARVAEALGKQAGGGYHEIYRVIRPDGSMRWIRDQAVPIKDSEGRVYRIVGTAEDITDWRKLEDQFRQAQKLEAIGTLAGGIAHDFNNILSAIIGYIELSKLTLKGSNKQAGDYLDNVLQGAHRAAALVRQILAFSRQQEQQRVTVQLRHVVAEPVKLLRATIPATIEFDVNLATNLPVVQADPTQVHQIVMNLCTNAAHAMKDRPGKLSVRLEKFLMDARQTGAPPGLRPGLYVKLTVADSGTGMDRATLERIFEPFFTTKKPGEGTGLGLSVVHGIMQSHEGEVAVHSTPGLGTTFELYFPAEGTGAVETERVVEESPMRGDGQRILFVDDEKTLALLGQSILETLGYQATPCADVNEAIRYFQADPFAFDMVVTDLAMPGMTGTDLAGQLLKIRPDLPIILTTGFTAKLTPESVRSFGIRELLLKPFTLRTLGSAVYRVLAKQRSSSLG